MTLISAAPNRSVFASFAVLLIFMMLPYLPLAVDSDYGVFSDTGMGINKAKVTGQVFVLTVITMSATVSAGETECKIA